MQQKIQYTPGDFDNTSTRSDLPDSDFQDGMITDVALEVQSIKNLNFTTYMCTFQRLTLMTAYSRSRCFIFTPRNSHVHGSSNPVDKCSIIMRGDKCSIIMRDHRSVWMPSRATRPARHFSSLSACTNPTYARRVHACHTWQSGVHEIDVRTCVCPLPLRFRG